MLERLYIENVAVIEKSEIEFTDGLNILTGQTGAGKSIIIDSLSLLLGQRASKDIIRTGSNKAYVSAAFSDVGERVVQKLNECDIPMAEDGTLFIERQLSLDGKSSSKINGRPVSLMTLKELAEPLVNIHGQHMNQRILDPALHIDFLDAYAENEKERSDYYELYKKTMEARRELIKLQNAAKEATEKADINDYRITELTNAKLSLGEEEALTQKRSLMVNAEKLSEAVEASIALLSETQGNAVENISQAAGVLLKAGQYSAKLNELSTKLNGILPEIEDIGIALKDIRSEIDFEPGELDRIENRLSQLSLIKKKYGGSIESAINELEKYTKEKELFENSDEKIQQQNAVFNSLAQELVGVSAKLTQSRKEAAQRLSQTVMEKLSFLDMEKCVFKVQITQHEKFTPNGRDNIEFYISANIGEEPKPLAKIASGGELSRIMLAIINALSEKNMPDTLIFDEVDTGVSGKTAQKIGVLIKSVSKNTQVLCVTHLAQIAAMAHRHLFISKSTDGVKTYTKVEPLSEEARREEIARIIGGADITSAALNMADDLISQGNKY